MIPWSEKKITWEISKEGIFVIPVKGGTVIIQFSRLMRAYHWLIILPAGISVSHHQSWSTTLTEGQM